LLSYRRMTLPEATSDPKDADITKQVETLAETLFSGALGPNGVVLGITNNDVVADNLRSLVTDPGNTVATYTVGDKLVGFSVAVPIDKMDSTRSSESQETAYIYFTGVQPELQSQGHVGPLMDDMYRKLRTRGYQFVERDSMIENGYADNVEKANEGAIDEGSMYDYDPWGLGMERHFRIDLSKAP